MAATFEHFTVEEAASGVWALLAGDTGACISNAAIVDLGTKTVVADTFMTLAAGNELIAAVQSLTGRTTFLAVNSHWHDDHTGGNQLLGDVPIVSTRRTTELISANGVDDPEAYAAEIETYFAWAREQEEAAETAEQQHRAAAARKSADLLFADRHRFRLTLPNVFIDERMSVHGAERELEILTYGGGHTASDVFVWLPGERMVVAGDLVWVGRHPRTKDGDPQAWAAILDRMALLGPEGLIPGHGPIAGDDYLGVLADYLREVAGVIAESAGLDAAEIARLPVPPGSEDWIGPHNFIDGVATLA